MKSKALIFSLMLSLTALPSFSSAGALPDYEATQALNGEHREASNRSRDRYRHPLETLAFFGLTPGQTVLEVWPGRGWYTEVLAPLTRGRNTYYAAGFATSTDDSPEWRVTLQKAYAEKLAAHPEVYDHVRVTELAIPSRTDIAPPGSVDLLMTFRNVHNWMKGDYAEDMFRVFYTTVKPGGTLGVVEHRARPGTSVEDMITSGYVTEEHVIRLAEAAGFVLEARSEINANPRDNTEHKAGVWTLPPTLRHCKKLEGMQRPACEKHYHAIGESDRMTLRFKKP